MTQTNATMKPLPHRQAGMSIIELMVALTISLLLLTGLVTLVGNSNQNFQELTRTSQQQENGRYAWQLLRDELRLAGFYGELFAVPEPGATLPDPCTVNNVDAQIEGLAFPIQGYDEPSASPLTCIPDHLAGTDILVVRRASTDTTPRPGLLHIQSTPRGFQLNTLADGEAEGTSDTFNLTWRAWDSTLPVSATNYPPPTRPYLVRIYYISPFSVTAEDAIPTLKRVEVGATGTTVVPLVEGIENMQLVYGIDDTGSASGGGGDGNADRYETAPANWADVVTAEVHLLARNIERTAGYVDDKTYTLGTTVIDAPGDAFKRHVYTASVRLNNPAGRKEE